MARYDARGALHELSRLEAPQGGFDWRMELTKAELDVELLCDEERYRALHTDEDEEEMYKEEELKRLHAAGYGQVGFNYDNSSQPQAPQEPGEVEEPFVPTEYLKSVLPQDAVLPETQKEHVIIEKTAKFVATQGAQMEILIKAKQGDNPQFRFMNKDSPLHPYYNSMISLIKAEKWPEKIPQPMEENPAENEDYLHPTLGSVVIESAPSIPSIHYKPSADCDYTLLIHKMRGEAPPEEAYDESPAPGEEPPPGTAPSTALARPPDISRPPMLYQRPNDSSPTLQGSDSQNQQYTAYYHQYMAQNAAIQQNITNNDTVTPSTKSTGLSLMKHYDSDSNSDDSDSNSHVAAEGSVSTLSPPEEVRLVIDKMAAYVARNGDDFADIVRSKRDPRFAFLEVDDKYHQYYMKLMQQKRGVKNGAADIQQKNSVPVSFSIKKPKDPEPILPKPALPYESSSEEESENTAQDIPKTNIPQTQPYTYSNVPQVVVYKIEGAQQSENSDLPLIRAIPTTKATVSIPNTTPAATRTVTYFTTTNTRSYNETKSECSEVMLKETKEANLATEQKKMDMDGMDDRKDRKKHSKRKELKPKYDSEHRSKSEKRSSEKKNERDAVKSKKKHRKRDFDKEVVDLERIEDDAIDLTGDLSDSKDGEGSREAERRARRAQRAAALLRRAGVTPAAAAALPATSLASAMAETIESLRKKKAAEEEKSRRREKKRQREKYDYDDSSHRKSKKSRHRSSDDEDSDYSSYKKRKRKDKKHISSKHKRKRRREVEEEEEAPVINIDLTNTLKELRNASPTKELGLDKPEEVKNIVPRNDSSDEEELARRKRKRQQKEERQYSEGEWSSDSEADSSSGENS